MNISRKGKCFIENHVCYIPLQEEGKFAICDEQFLDLVNKYSWRCDYKKGRKLHYVVSKMHGERVILHRLLLKNPESFIDHENGDILDNRLVNLRQVTNQQNGFNRKISKNNKSGYRGVCWQLRLKAFHAQICKDGVITSITRSKDPAECAAAYDLTAIAIFREYSRLNFKDADRPKLSEKCQDDVDRAIHFYKTGERILSSRYKKDGGKSSDAVYISKMAREIMDKVIKSKQLNRTKFVEQAILEKIQKECPEDFNLIKERYNADIRIQM